MKAAGTQRLHKLRNSIHALNTSQIHQEWLLPVLDKLPESTVTTLKEIYIQQQSNHLNKVLGFVSQQVEASLANNQVLSLIQNIIRFLYLPDALDNFFLDDSEVQWALLTLHPTLQIKIRIKLLECLDELFIGCVSAAEFIDKEAEPHLYKILDAIIRNANKYVIQRTRTNSHLSSSLDSQLYPSSFSSLFDINLRQLTYLSPLAAAEDNNQSNVSSSTVSSTDESGPIIANIHKDTLSPTLVDPLFTEHENYIQPSWMREGLLLGSDLLSILKEYQEILYQKFCNETYTISRKIEHKLAFLDEIIHKAEHGLLTPAAFFKASQNKPYLFSASFRSYMYKLWQELCRALKESLWQKAIDNTEDTWGYSVTDQQLINTLTQKRTYLQPKVAQASYHGLSANSRARWYQEKRAALDYIFEKHQKGKLSPHDFHYIRLHFPLFTAVRLKWFKKSETEYLITQFQDYIKEILWVDAGGKGEQLQTILQQTQGKTACIPNYRRLLCTQKLI